MATKKSATKVQTERARAGSAARAAIAANIRRLREERGLSQQQLAEIADVSTIYLAALEQARPTANPTLRVLVAVASALGCQLGDLTAPAALERRSVGRPPRLSASNVRRRAT